MTRPEILFLAHRIPYPPDKGDKIRSWRLFDHLSQRFRVHLACFVDDPQDHAYAPFLRSRSASAVFIDIDPTVSKIKSIAGLWEDAPLSFRYFYSRPMADAVKRIRARPLAAEVAFSSAMAQYLTPAIGERRRLIDFCDADSEKWRQYADTAFWPLSRIYQREAKRLAEAETEIANWADAAFAVSPEEAAVFNDKAAVKRRVVSLRNGVDVDYFHPHRAYSPASFQPDAVFVGAMDYRANIEAVERFVHETWPLVRAEAPKARFAIVGRNPAPSVRALHGKDGVTVTGRVDDVRPWLSSSKVVVAPLQVARGVQNKVLEALAMAKPVVATPQAALGVQVGERALCVAADPADYAARILELLDNPARRARIGANARAAVMRNHDWAACLSDFDSVLEGFGLYQSSSSSSSFAASASA